jgi:AraC family transcriptional regulator, regulatory protein of adaptative response / methylated-DNA-[protein]-cysteine methyltransferase
VVNDYQRVAQAIEYLDETFRNQPSLKEIATAVGVSEFHFQRLFRRWAGISPKRFLQFVTAEYARSLLVGSRDMLDVTYGSGLSGPGRLHDLFVNIYAATPSQVRELGAGLVVRYGFAPTSFGECLAATTERGVCALSFVAERQRTEAFRQLARRWSRSTFERDDSVARAVAARIFSAAKRATAEPLTVFLQGTNFQIRVWEALLRVPPGKAVTYEGLAAGIGVPGAARAVGLAVGHNPVAYLIPCHRVLLKSGAFGGYRWGSTRKRAMLAWEAVRTQPR